MQLVERETALGALEQSWAGTGTGAGRTLLVEGEAGIGKTSLLRAFTASLPAGRTGAANTAPVVAWGHCEPLGAGRPFGPLHDAARVLGGRLAAVMASRHDRFDVLSTALETLGAPHVLVVEDLHWADEATLDLLLFLARSATEHGSLVVGTLRPDALATQDRLAEVVGHLSSLDRVDRLTLEPLTVAGVARLSAGCDAAAVHRVTGGNPFFATEVLRHPGSLPVRVRDAVRSRVATLGPEAQSVLRVASLLPEAAEVDLLLAASGADAAALAECESADLLSSSGGRVQFRHEIARRAIAETIPGPRRLEIHRLLLDELARRPGTHPARLSFHASEAADGDGVLVFARRAATQAAHVGAHREAVVHLRRAAAYAERLPDAERGDLHAETARELDLLALSPAAIAASHEALAAYADAGSVERRAVQLARHAHLLWSAGRPGEARDAVARSLELAEELPGSLAEATARTWSAYLRMLARDLTGALEVGEQAVAQARALGDAHLLARALNAVGSAAWLAGDTARGEAQLRESRQVAEEAGDDERVGAALVNLGSSAGESRDYAVASSALQECRDWCGQRDLEVNHAYARAWLARVAFEQGHWDEAAAATGTLLDDPVLIARTVAVTTAGHLAVRRGTPDAPRLLAAAWELATRTDDVQRLWPAAAARAEAAWMSGDHDELVAAAEPVYRRALALDHAWSVGELGSWLHRVGAVRPDPARAAAPFAAQLRGDWAGAAATWLRLGCPYEAALARAESHEADEVAEAVRALDALGAGPAADRAAERLRELGGVRPRRPRRSTVANPAGLTDRQVEVLALVADGLSDAEIGARLFISTKTAGHHVSAVLAKLGVGSRREAAASARSLGLDQQPGRQLER